MIDIIFPWLETHLTCERVIDYACQLKHLVGGISWVLLCVRRKTKGPARNVRHARAICVRCGSQDHDLKRLSVAPIAIKEVWTAAHRSAPGLSVQVEVSVRHRQVAGRSERFIGDV